MNRFRLRRVVWVAMAALVCAPTAGYATQVVFDPTNFAKELEQAQQDARLVQEFQQQLQNQLKMLQHWGYSQLAGILQSMHQWQSALHASAYAASDPGPALNAQYPASPQDYAAATSARMQAAETQWQQDQRDAVVENRTVQNHIAQDLEPTAQRMQAYVERSNAAPGPTAALQAGNEELATVVAQVQALQALEITSSRTDAQLEAQRQAERAYHEAEAQKVMANFYHPPRPSGQVSHYFDQQ